ncbi:MAG TPA: lysoplasmalogenase [Cyclobacteriaceae bacterium]|nr:lysoplasmalogenase [Cyclobacteriaceae bacterium]
MKNSLRGLFIAISIGEIVALMAGLEYVHQILKPLIMIVLGSYYLATIGRPSRSISLLLAIVLSFLGDVLLLFPGEQYFMLGLGSFLFAHISYILTYRKHRWYSGRPLPGTRKIRYSLPIILSGTGLLIVLYPHLGPLLVPVSIYAIVLMIMVLNAMFRYGLTSVSSFWMVFMGALLFMLSDSLLAINKFMTPIEDAGVFIMAAYISGQYLIVEGLIRHSHQE